LEELRAVLPRDRQHLLTAWEGLQERIAVALGVTPEVWTGEYIEHALLHLLDYSFLGASVQEVYTDLVKDQARKVLGGDVGHTSAPRPASILGRLSPGLRERLKAIDHPEAEGKTKLVASDVVHLKKRFPESGLSRLAEHKGLTLRWAKGQVSIDSAKQESLLEISVKNFLSALD
jgi:hypothetical protein